MAKLRVAFDFEEKDNLLTYFASKAQIAEDCPSQLSFFYNIQLDSNAKSPVEVGSDSDNGELMYL